MTSRIKFLFTILIINVLPAFSQSREADILSGIVSGYGEILSVAGQDMDSGINGVLDYMTGNSGHTNVIAALSGITAPSGRPVYNSSISALDVVTGAYSATGFYNNGSWNNNVNNSYLSAPRYGDSYGGTLVPPLGWGRITSGFGYRAKFNRMHKGIDIAMAVGDTVRAVLPGVIDRVNYEAHGYGHYIVLKHDNGMETRYAHLSLPLVTPGQRVYANEAIALSGNTGNSTGPHLHFETRFFGQAVDPTTVFDFNGSGSQMYRSLQAPLESNVLATGFNGSKKNIRDKNTYIVRQGDTLKKIADRAGISVYRLCQLNFIMDNQTPQPGTMLKLR